MDLTLLHRGSSVQSIAPYFNSDSTFDKWAKKPLADNLLEASSSGSKPQKLMLNNIHMSGSFLEHDYPQIGCSVVRLGHDLHAFPPRKLRKLMTTFSDGAHVFSCVEKVNLPVCADLDWPTTSAHQSYLGKKRPWHLCRLSYGVNELADPNIGLFGGRSLSRMHHQDDFCMHVWETGGSVSGGDNGNGGGGGSHGNDNGGSQQPDFDGAHVPILMSWHTPAEQHQATAKAETDDTGISESLLGTENITICGDRMDMTGDVESKHACSLHGAPHHVLYQILEDLDRVLIHFIPDFKRLTRQDNQNFLCQHGKAPQYGLSEIYEELQDIDLASADDSIFAEIKGNSDTLLEKLSGLTLGSAGDSIVQAQTVSMIKTMPVQTLESKEATVVDDGDLMASTTSKEVQSSSAFKSKEGQTPASRQLRGVVHWLNRLAHNASENHGEDHESLENQVDDKKLRALVNDAVSTAVKQLSDADGAPVPAKQADMEALKRLQREVFSELLKLREKLDQVASARNSESAKHSSGTGKTNLQGEVKVGMAFVMLEDRSSQHSRGSLEQAGMQTGVDVKLTFETPFREKDLLITQCIAGQGSSVGESRALGGPMSLGKVQYLAHINDDVSISFVPMGARGMDMTDIVNPMQDQGLTSFSSRGPALFDQCQGSAIGASWSGSSFALSAAHYLSGWGNQALSLGTDTRESGPLCMSTLGQLLLQPTERLIFSLSALNRFWPSPPLPSSMGLHWSEMGPLVIPKICSLQTSRSTMSSEDSFLSHCNSMSSHWGMLESEYHLDPPESKGASQLSVAVATEMELSENVSLGAWAQADDVHQDLDKGSFQWAVNLSKTSNSGVDWGASIGGSKPDLWSISTSEQEIYPGYVGSAGNAYGPQLHLEAFVRLNCGKGFTLQPGLLYLLNKHSRTPAFIVRSNWLF